MKKTRRNIIFAGALIVLMSVGFTTIGNKDLELVKNLDIYYTLFRELNMFYVDETDPQELVTTSIDAMLSSLDPYTTYIPESSMDDFKFQTTGEYGGIGSLIRRSGDYTIIADPYKGFPADKVGIRAGDKILKVDGKSAENMAIESVSDQLKGKPGTEIVLTVERFGEEKPLDFTLVREKISIRNVPYYGMLNEQTGYIRIANFTTGAGLEVENALKELKEEHGMQSLVLDLRANPGGLLIEAVRICNLFVDKGELIGAALRTRLGVKPIYVSVGHKINLISALEWVMKCCRGYRLPEPTRLAHLAAGGMLTSESSCQGPLVD